MGVLEARRAGFRSYAPAEATHLACAPAQREEGLLLCRADLDRPLTAEERAWFDTAQDWRMPSPGRFLFSGPSVHFLCPPDEKSDWIAALARYLEFAASLRPYRSDRRSSSQPRP
jgi:hypothetical protein